MLNQIFSMTNIIAPCMVLLVLALGTGQNPSPCPDVFQYKPQGNESDRWYGNILLNTSENLTGLWLHIQLDQPASLLGNWLGEATSTDNIEFDIINKKYKLGAGVTASVLFFVRYKDHRSMPSISKILLNGKSICGTQKTKANSPSSNSNRPESSNRPNTNSDSGSKALTVDEGNVSDSDLEIFQGDWATIKRRKQFRPSIQPLQNIYNPGCGIVAPKASPLILYGEDTAAGQWPWHAALFYPKSDQTYYYICGGTLITQQHILTAAHCVTDPETNRAVSPNRILIQLGLYDLDIYESEKQESGVSKITVHQNYKTGVYFNDIAVLKLLKPAEITNFVRTCCLWEGESDDKDIINKEGILVGWGLTENGTLKGKLLETKMPVVSKEKCIFSNREFYLQFIFEKNFCAGNGTSPCNGDSGGGMVFPKKGTSGQNTVWQIRGLVSFGIALQKNGSLLRTCNNSQYAVFTDVAKYTRWIQDIVAQ